MHAFFHYLYYQKIQRQKQILTVIPLLYIYITLIFLKQFIDYMNNQLFPFYQTFIHKTGKIDHTQVQLLRNQNSYL